jgi:hypothetical protein
MVYRAILVNLGSLIDNDPEIDQGAGYFELVLLNFLFVDVEFKLIVLERYKTQAGAFFRKSLALSHNQYGFIFGLILKYFYSGAFV